MFDREELQGVITKLLTRAHYAQECGDLKTCNEYTSLVTYLLSAVERMQVSKDYYEEALKFCKTRSEGE